MARRKVVALYSGGTDSTALILYLLQHSFEVFPLYMEWEEKAVRCEKFLIKKCYSKYWRKKYSNKLHSPYYVRIGTVDIRNYIENKLPIKSFPGFPARNLIFISYAATYALRLKIENVAMALNFHDVQFYHDANMNFLKCTKKILRIISNNMHFRLITPFLTWQKSKIINFLEKNKVKLEDTLSCYSPVFIKKIGWLHCGSCRACLQRIDACIRLSKEDKTKYISNFRK